MSNSKTDKILVVGGTGTVGSEVTSQLKKEGYQVRITSSKPSQNPEAVQVNLISGEGLEAAFSGIDRAFFLSPGGYADQYQMLAPLIEKAKENKLKKVVLMSAMGAEQNAESPLRRAEVLLENSGLAYNIIRPSWFMQNFNSFWVYNIQTQNQIRLPVADGKTGFIDTRDIAAVAAKLLTSDKHNNEAFGLTGPELLDHSQVAELISNAAGRTIEFIDIDPEELKQTLLGIGLPADYTEFLLLILGFLKAGYSAVLTNSVQDILGREPISFKQYAEDYKNAWKAAKELSPS